MKFSKRTHKIFSVVASVVMFVQPLFPVFSIWPQVAYAQEEPTPTETVTPEVTPTAQPEITLAPTPTEEVTPEPTVEITPEITPTPETTITPTDIVEPTPTVTQNQPTVSESTPQQTNGPPEQGDILDGVSTVAPTSTIAPSVTEQGALKATVLENIQAESLDFDSIDYSSATLTTDKVDYAPTDTALISGTGFKINHSYSLTVSSNDQPATSTTVQVTTDTNGSFVYAYQLDGIYRPNYKVEIWDESKLIATTTFTDSNTSANNASVFTSIGSGSSVAWTNPSNIQTSNNIYASVTLKNKSSGDLKATGFGFSIPVGSTIDGIIVNVEKNAAGADIRDLNVQLINGSSALVGTNKANTSSAWSTSPTDATVSYGSASDTWSAGLTYSDVNSVNFGVSFSARNAINTDETANVDQITVQVYYTVPVVTPTLTPTPTNSPTPTPIVIPTPPTSNCFIDAQGENDEPGQKDLTKMCADVSNLPTSIRTWLNLDDTAWGGGNTGNACNLFDTDGDGNANYSMCIVVGGSPAGFQSRTLYSCGDDRVDRCTSPVVTSPTTATCGAGVLDDDPFNTSNDTVGYCSTNLSELGSATTANLIDVCSYPSEQPNSDPSDCIFYKNNTGKLVVNKVLVPSDDSGKFNLQIDTVNVVTDIGNGGTTGEQILAIGNHTIAEIAGASTSLANYTSAIDCKLLHGTGSSIASTTNSSSLTVPIADGDDIVCTITNTRVNNASLTIVKDAVPNDTQDFAFTTTGAGLSNFSLDDDADATLSNTKVFNNLASGTYSVAEGALTGWTQTSATCTDGSPVTAINLSAGENVTCTFTNTKQAKLTVTKVVTNNSGGNKVVGDFPLFVNGNSVTSGVQNNFVAGNYTVTETGNSTYTGTFSGDCNALGEITLANGDVKSCTLTNDDNSAHLIVIKQVINDNGGTATASSFTMSINSVTANGGNAFSGAESPGTDKTLTSVGPYSVTESGPSGYAATYSTDCTGTIALGETKTCTITNDDIAPTLTLVKRVTNDDGGSASTSAWTLAANGSAASFSGNTPVVGTVVAGVPYTLSETGGPTGYEGSAWDCDGGSQDGTTITLGLDEDVTCAIVNDDQPGTLIVKKVVINDNGGTATASSFGFKVNNGSTTAFEADGQNDLTVNAGTYTVIENSAPGYATSYDNCSQVQIPNGGSATCTITNDDIQPKLTVTKVVTNDDGGTKVISDFPLFVNQTGVVSGVQNGFNVGAYTVNETESYGYTATFSGDCSKDGSISLDLGDEKQCTITNDDIAPTLTLVKTVINDNGGKLKVSDFPLYVSGVLVTSNTPSVLSAGSYVATESGAYGYAASTWGHDCDENGNVTLSVGDEKTCTIINDDIQPKLTVTKIVEGGSAQVEDFPLFVNQTEVVSGAQNGFDADTYTVGETNQPGYTGIIGGDCNPRSGSVKLSVGDVKSCTITNTRDTGTIIVHKRVDTDGDGTYDSGDETANTIGFRWGLDGVNPSNEMGSSVSGVTTLDTHTVAENILDGYEFTGWFYAGEDASCTSSELNTELPANLRLSSNGQTQVITLCNKLLNPILTISKTNNAGGDKSAGDSVGFTLTVEATQSAAYNVKVTDLLPDGFKYRTGSWTANSTTRGDLKSLGVTTEPTYASPGTWILGDMAIGEIVTLSYIADISNDQKPGLYKDLAWAYGCRTGSECTTGDSHSVVSNAINPGYVSDTFVGTQVNVVKNLQSGSSHNVTINGEVLGASTELPDTGADSAWLIIATLTILIGLGFIAAGKFAGRKYV